MISISSKCKYGIQAVVTLAENYEQGLLPIKEISSRNNIPEQYLVQIFNLLVKADIINSVRGKNGGYKLSRNPSKITALEIIEVLEGEIEFVEKNAPNDDPTHDLFSDAEKILRGAFQMSLADLISRQKEKAQALFYDI